MLRQKLQQKLQQKLSPQQIQLMKLIQLPVGLLEQRVKQEIEENPALEEGKDEEEVPFDNSENESDNLNDDVEFSDEEAVEDKDVEKDNISLSDYLEFEDDDEVPYYKYNISNTSPDDERREIPFSVGPTSEEHLLQQLGLKELTPREMTIAQNIIGNLDDSGYLVRDIESISNDVAFLYNINTTKEEVEKVLKVVQELEPPGIGARNLQECLLIQLERKYPQTEAIKNAKKIIKDHFTEFTKKHYDKIGKRLSLTEKQLKEAIDEILKLNPKPGDSLPEIQRTNQYIVPDFILTTNNGKLDVVLNSKNAPELKINKAYSQMLEELISNKNKQNVDQQKEAIQFVRQKIESAKWFIEAINQRNETLLQTVRAIINFQYDYFSSGDETKLKPMILKDISNIVKLDISTISRVVSSKYIQTPFGTFPLKSFFSEALSTESGDEVSSIEIKKILEECVANEDKRKPLTDDQLAKILKEKGYNIARRTVAKYRKQLNIPVARLRKEI